MLQAEDIRAALHFLQSQGKAVSALAGHSKAGTGVICYSAKYRDIPRVVNISGRFDCKEGQRFGFGIQDCPEPAVWSGCWSNQMCVLDGTQSH